MKGPSGQYAWTARVGEKGQIVIPKEARQIFSQTGAPTFEDAFVALAAETEETR